MKKLIWKELREMRLIPVAIALLTSVLILVYNVISVWMSTHGFGLSERMTPNDCDWLLILGLVACGTIAGSVAIAPEVGNGTLAFLTSLPISRFRLWTAKVITGSVVVATSAAAVTLAFIATLSWLFPGVLAANASWGFNTAFIVLRQNPFVGDWIGDSGLHMVIAVIAVTICFYCVSLLVSTIVDRTVTAVVVAVVASLAAGIGLFYMTNFLDGHTGFQLPDFPTSQGNLYGVWLDEHDPNSFQAIAVAYGLVVLGLLSTSFIAFSQGGSLRTGRRLVIAAVTLSAWFAASGLGFAAYSRHWQYQWNTEFMARSAAWTANMAEYRKASMKVIVPTVHGQHWTVLIDCAAMGGWDGSNYVANIDIGTNDLDTPGVVPVHAYGGINVNTSIESASAHRWDGPEYFRGAPNVTAMPGTSGRRATSRRIAPGRYLATVTVVYRPLPPAGQHRQTVQLYDKRGRMIGAIDIIANEAPFVDHCKTAPGGACW